MKIIYRISDKGEVKEKPHFVTKRGIFEHFCIIFKDYDIYVVADNVSNETYDFIQRFVDASKIQRTVLGNAGSLLYSFDLVIKEFADDQKVYLAEDDYIYMPEAPKIIEEGLDVADYASGYDHPDKYNNRSEGGPNPFVENGGESTRVIITRSRHWKETNSTCMTFGTTVRIIKEDRDVYEGYCQVFPRSFEMFGELIQKKQRRLITCLPAVSTHGESSYLSPFVNWEEIFKKSLCNEMIVFLHTAVIVEPRKHKALAFVLDNVAKCLSAEWQIIIFHGTSNVEFVENIVASTPSLQSVQGRVKLVNLQVEGLTKITYSKLLTRKDIIYPHITTEMFLVFQTDSVIIFENRHLIEEYLEYDYVGAPWRNRRIGNGGLSLRRKSKMLEVIDARQGAPNDDIEDLFFCDQEEVPLKMPGFDKARRFSVETCHADNNVFFGCHAPWIVLKMEDMVSLYPDIQTLMSLQ